jgi:hypothetical protein
VGKQKGALTMSETVRRAVLESNQTWYRVAKDSGVPYATLHRFVTSQRAVSMETLDKLCAYLGLRLVR